MFWIIFWVAVVVFVAVEGALLYTVVKFRRKNRRFLPRQTHGNKSLEIAWTIVPTIILVFIAVPILLYVKLKRGDGDQSGLQAPEDER